jgi:hypothetical protein
MDNQTTEIVEIKSDDEVAEIIRQDLDVILEKTQSISRNALVIKNQGGWDAFWNKSKNIQSLASYTNDMALLHQKTINLLVLLLNGTVRMKTDYNEIMETIEVLSKEESDVQTLNYLLELKKSIKIIKERNNFISDEFDALDKEINKIQEFNRETIERNNAKFSKMEDTIKNVSGKIEITLKENEDHLKSMDRKIELLNDKNAEFVKSSETKIMNIDNDIKNKFNIFQKNLKTITIIFSVFLSGIIIYEIIKIIIK